jgi:hypothetical protein
MERAERRTLEEVQRRLWRLITAPDGVEAGLRAEADGDGEPLAALIRGERGIPPVDRLSVYAHAYFGRLHDCLREDFGALARALGADAFHDLVQTYLMMHPPSRPSLRHAGARLAGHLETKPFAAIFSRRCPYAADLARLEWAMAEAFHAADSPVLAREHLAAVPPEAWGGLGFEAVPSLQLLACAWPVHVVRERFDREDPDSTWDEPPALAAEPACLRVWRLDERVRHCSVAPLELEALAAAQSGASFAAICDHLASALGEAQAAAHAASLLASWVSDGILARLR